MQQFKDIFPASYSIIAVIHLKALPGAPAYRGSIDEILETAMREAQVYQEAGVEGLMIENMHDTPYLKREVGHEISAAMTLVGYEVKRATKLPCGIQILAGANKAALAVAKAAGLDFIRAEGFVFAHVADEGIIESDAGELLRYRKMIDAADILILTDVKKKHSAHALTSDVDIVETAIAAGFFRSDGLIVTGTTTGQPADVEELHRVRAASGLPLLAGSGITIDNAQKYRPYCDAMIIGSHFKKDGYWGNELDAERVKRFCSS